MAKIAEKLTDLIGNTPLLELAGYAQANNSGARIIAKLECFNPLGVREGPDRFGHDTGR